MAEWPEWSASLADRYRFERELGRGGMATVYLVRDLRHDRPVALKVLHPDLAAALGPERFQREIMLAARLHHPHILTVLDSGESAGRLWFTMPFVQGESLRDRLTRERQLPLGDALRIAREAADALDFAHRQGILHRDIKPENLLLSENHALVADFGIAHTVDANGGGELTGTGVTLGTPAYMSPEQATGERDLDGRSDVYALGVVLYEMLAGEPPFGGPTARVVLARRLTETARPLRAVRETIPEPVERTVSKAMARVPADRYATAADFGRAIESAAAAARTGATAAARLPARRTRWIPLVAPVSLGILIGAGALFGWFRKVDGRSAGAEPGGIKRLAVLPFENLGRPEDEYFADGITDEVRGKLAALPGLLVTASGSSAHYKKTTETPQQVAQELGVDYLLVGKVRWEKGTGGQSRVRVSPELVQASTGSTRWQQPFDAALTDVFQVQADVAARVAQALDLALSSGEREAMSGRPTTNLSAYDLYLKGNEAAGGFDVVAPVDLKRAIGYYERAVALDSAFALAWSQLSRAHTYVHWSGVPTVADEHKALEAAHRALALAPNLAEAHLALGDYYNLARKEWTPALAQYAIGRKLAPSNAELLKGEGIVARSQGRWEDSQEALTRAQALDPRSLGTGRRLTYNLLRLRRFPETLAQSDRTLSLAPSAPDLHQAKAMAYLAMGDLPGARRVLDAAQREAEPTALVAWMATYYDLFWALDDGQQQLLLRLPPGPFNDDRLSWGIAIAGTYAFRGDTARSRAYADSARVAGAAQIREAPGDGQLHALQGIALAYAGRNAEAIEEGKRALTLVPYTRDAYAAAYLEHQLARIYIMAGMPDQALDHLEHLLHVPYYLSPGWLRIDPTFDPLRSQPRFRKLVGGGAAHAAPTSPPPSAPAGPPASASAGTGARRRSRRRRRRRRGDAPTSRSPAGPGSPPRGARPAPGRRAPA